jgi:hypothetical protein
MPIMPSYIVTCKHCKAVRRVTPDIHGNRRARRYTLEGVRLQMSQTGWLNVPCVCGRTMLGKAIQGYASEQPCSAKCTSATGHVCECSCAGVNHGGAHST